jgi:hypothetical protein
MRDQPENEVFLCLGQQDEKSLSDEKISMEVASIVQKISEAKAKIYKLKFRAIDWNDYFVFRGSEETSFNHIIMEIVIPRVALDRVKRELCRASLEKMISKVKCLSHDEMTGTFELV